MIFLSDGAYHNGNANELVSYNYDYYAVFYVRTASGDIIARDCKFYWS